jgi:hypothetical protein
MAPLSIARSQGMALQASKSDYPLIGRVVTRDDDRLVAQRLFAPLTDPYLRDSLVDGRPFVPSALAWEALAESAELLLGVPVGGATELRAAGPLFLDADGQLAVRLEAERAGDRVLATLFAEVAGGAPKVRFGAEFHAADGAQLVVPRDVARAIDRRGQNGRNGHAVAADGPLQLGEALGGCVWARSLSFCELIGGIRAESEALFEPPRTPRFVLAPAVLECAFMLAGFGWYALTRQRGVPVGIEQLHVGRAPSEDEEVLCHVRLRASTTDGVFCDLYLLGADRTPLMQLRGLRMMRLERVVDMETERLDEVSWARFCQSLQDRVRGPR